MARKAHVAAGRASSSCSTWSTLPPPLLDLVLEGVHSREHFTGMERTCRAWRDVSRAGTCMVAWRDLGSQSHAWLEAYDAAVWITGLGPRRLARVRSFQLSVQTYGRDPTPEAMLAVTEALTSGLETMVLSFNEPVRSDMFASLIGLRALRSLDLNVDQLHIGPVGSYSSSSTRWDRSKTVEWSLPLPRTVTQLSLTHDAFRPSSIVLTWSHWSGLTLLHLQGQFLLSRATSVPDRCFAGLTDCTLLLGHEKARGGYLSRRAEEENRAILSSCSPTVLQRLRLARFDAETVPAVGRLTSLTKLMLLERSNFDLGPLLVNLHPLVRLQSLTLSISGTVGVTPLLRLLAVTLMHLDVKDSEGVGVRDVREWRSVVPRASLDLGYTPSLWRSDAGFLLPVELRQLWEDEERLRALDHKLTLLSGTVD